MFWPKDSAKVWAVLDVIMEKKIPFVSSYGTAMGLQKAETALDGLAHEPRFVFPLGGDSGRRREEDRLIR